ncbi:MAG TPA: 50S ribosomal protein L28 [Aggregatilineaceae bacterium]|nr:50S ribosomal protein L28 [Aggregatilineaceae bacterium]
MAKCEVCGKIPQFGNNVSHSKRRTKRQFKPNIQRVKVMENGRLVSRYMCAKCIRTLGKEEKVRK